MVFDGPSMRTWATISLGSATRDDKKIGSHSFVVYYLNYRCEAASVGAMGEENDAANFDKPPLGGVDIDFCHHTARTVG